MLPDTSLSSGATTAGTFALAPTRSELLGQTAYDEAIENLIDAGDGLQQLVRPGVRPHGRHQAGVDLGELAVQGGASMRNA